MKQNNINALLSTILLCVIAFSGCQSPQNMAVVNQDNNVPAASALKQTLTAEDILTALKTSKLPIEKEIAYTAENDPNKLLSRPNQYIGKANWNDKRVDALTPDERSMTVEVFASAEDLESRRKYVENIGKAMSALTQYQYVHKNALLRLDHKLTPEQAAEYEKVFKSL